MKITALLFRVFRGRVPGVLAGFVSLGALGGLVVALLTIGQVPKTYEAWSQVYPEIQPGAGLAATPEGQREWTEQLAAEMRAPEFLAAAATAAGMDKARGLTPEQCAGILAESLTVVTAQDSWARNRPKPNGSVLRLHITGNDAEECAAVLDGMQKELVRHIQESNEALRAASAPHQQYLTLVAGIPALQEEIAARTAELRTAIAGVSTRPAEQSPEALLAMTPPLVARGAHTALKSAMERLAAVREESARHSAATGSYYCYPWGGSGVPAKASGPVWEAHAWPRALTGAAIGGAAGLLMLLAGRRNAPRPQPLCPPVPHY